jgi:hypothetical protein
VIPLQEIQAALSPRSLSYSDVGPLSLEEFIVRLPAVVERCSTRQMAKCEPVKRLLGCVSGGGDGPVESLLLLEMHTWVVNMARLGSVVGLW